MAKTWVTSDWHFNHDKEFVWKARGFSDVNAMNFSILTNHNALVNPEDDVYVLGDLCMGADIEANKNLIEAMNGKIHIIYGNHDSKPRLVMYSTCANVVEVLGPAHAMKYGKYNIYLSHYPTMTGNSDEDKPLKTKVINIHGHTHQKDNFLEGQDLMYHAGVDSHDCKPILLDDAIASVREKFEAKRATAKAEREKTLEEAVEIAQEILDETKKPYITRLFGYFKKTK